MTIEELYEEAVAELELWFPRKSCPLFFEWGGVIDVLPLLPFAVTPRGE